MQLAVYSYFMEKPKISIVAAIGKNREIGKGDELLWHIPDDLRRFKQLTLGHPVIMGRKTFESIVASLGKPLPGRTNIVVTRDTSWSYANANVAHSIEDAIKQAKKMDGEEIFIEGGADIWKQSLPLADKLYLTLIDDEQGGDAFFPPYEDLFPTKTLEEEHQWNGLKYRWVDLEK